MLDLQRAAGNQAVARALAARRGSAPGRLLRSTIEVKSIDFDPTEAEEDAYTAGEVNDAGFYLRLQQAITSDTRFKLYLGQLRNVIDDLKQEDFSGDDVDKLAKTIATRAQELFSARNLAAISSLEGPLLTHVVNALSASLRAGHRPMDAGEAEGFDRLRQIVVAEQSRTQGKSGDMSRSKEKPSPVPYGRLPGELKSSVDERVAGMNAENQRWSAAALTTQEAIPSEFSRAVAEHQRNNNRYQGNHTNNAGWLPKNETPVNALADGYERVYSAASSGLRRRLDDNDRLELLHLAGGNVGRDSGPLREFQRLLGRPPYGLDDEDLRRSIWAALAQGVSPYIEFSTKDAGISRLLYNVIDDRIYLTAHYKWREGYNPFFEVTGAPKPTFG